MGNTDGCWTCPTSLQVHCFGHCRANTLRLNATGSSLILYIYVFPKTKLWGSDTVPERSALAQTPLTTLHTKSSIRILPLPRPCRDLVVNPQSRSAVYHPPTQVLPSGRGHICSHLVYWLLGAHQLLLWRWCMYIRVLTSVLVVTVEGAFPK